jgi:hypothetical protein
MDESLATSHEPLAMSHEPWATRHSLLELTSQPFSLTSMSARTLPSCPRSLNMGCNDVLEKTCGVSRAHRENTVYRACQHGGHCRSRRHGEVTVRMNPRK